MTLNEIMFDPAGNENTDEFVELYNDGQFAVNLDQWLVTDGQDTDRVIALDQGIIVAPGQYVLILDPDYVEDSSSTYDGRVPQSALLLTIDNATIGSRGLSNSSAERITLLNAQAQPVSSIEYSLGNQPGHSEEKILPTGGDELGNWANSIILHGTPGGMNSVTPPLHDLGIASISIIPESPSVGEWFAVRMSIRNYGRESLDGAVRLSDRISGQPDSLFELESWNLDLLIPGDSTILESSPVQLIEDGRRLVAEIEAPDDRPENNRRSVLVGIADEGGIRINEIMYSPESGRSEWIELANSGSEVSVLSGWQFCDGQGLHDSTRRLTLPSISLGPDSLMIIAADSQIYFEYVPEAIPISIWVGSSISLNNTGDSLFLFSSESELIDRVDYRPSWGGSEGVSLERISLAAQSQDDLNWASSVDSSGSTPGRVNSQVVSAAGGTTEILDLTPNPFSPDGDGHEDLLRIRFQLDHPDSRLDIRVYDVRGRLVAERANNLPVAMSGELLWDGAADNGRELPTGLYVIYLEALGQGGDRIQRAKRPVALVRMR